MKKKIRFTNIFVSILLIFAFCLSNTALAVSADTLPVGINYTAHVQNIGWMPTVTDGAEAGTDGKGLRVEALKINLVNAQAGAKIDYEAHVQNIGWQRWVSSGDEAGTHGQSLRVEALKIKLENMPNYSVVYQAHVQNIGWQNWVSDGDEAGTDGQSLRVEAIRIKIVPKVNVSSISINKNSDTLTNVGDTDTLTASINPSNATNNNIDWTSSNNAVVTVDKTGKITAVNSGTAVITVASEDGNKTATCTVTVLNSKISINSITLNKTTDTLNIGSSDALISTINPTNATDKTLKWTSSNNGVATVDITGKINAINAGSATVTAASTDGSRSATCSITVVNPVSSPDEQTNEKTKEIIANIIKPGMNTVNKELAIHDYIVANTSYDAIAVNNNNVPDDEYTSHGILVNHIGVCEGYAHAFKTLCDLEGITCIVVDDDSLDHAWNIVQLDDGNYYQVDCTWDDPVSSDGTNSSNYIGHRYFNISDKQLFSDHNVNTAEWASYNYPKCNVDNSEFYSNTDVNAASNGNYIYTDVNGNLSRVDSSGNIATISSDNAEFINYYNGYVYYLNNNNIYRIDTNGDNRVNIAQGNIFKMYLYNGSLYYIDTDDWMIHKLDLAKSSNTNQTVTSASYTRFFITNDSLYYEDLDASTNKYMLHKKNLSTMADTEILTLDDNNSIDSLNDEYLNYGNYIYYKSDTGVYSTDLNGNNQTLISNNLSNSDGYDMQMFSNYLYYNSTLDNNWYKASLDGTGVTSLVF